MGGWIKYLAAAVVAVGACGCTAPFYMQSRQGTAVGSGMPAPQEIDSLTRHRMTVGAEETFSLLLGVLLWSILWGFDRILPARELFFTLIAKGVLSLVIWGGYLQLTGEFNILGRLSALSGKFFKR